MMYTPIAFVLLALQVVLADTNALPRSSHKHNIDSIRNALDGVRWSNGPTGDKSSLFLIENKSYFIRCIPPSNNGDLSQQNTYSMELKKRFEAVNQFKYLQSPLFPTFLEEIRVEKHGSCLLYNTNDRIKHTLKDVIPVIKADKDKRWLTHVISQVIMGIYELHSRGYIHSAILSENVLVSDYSLNGMPTVNIVGLEHALYVKSKKQIKLNVIFDNAMPPEVAANDLMSGYPYDSWMLGALIYECFTGHLPYEVARTGKSAAHIEALKFTKLTLTTAYHNKLNFCPQIAGPLDKLSMNEMPLLSLVDGLMAPSPGERPSIIELSMVASNQWIKYRRGDRHNKIPV